MTNKIGNNGVDSRPAQVASERGVKRAKDATVSTTPTAAPAKAAGVSITDSARQLAALEQAIRTLPEVNAERVAAIRAAIAHGTYEVSPDRIAEKLLRMEQDLV